jgi:hypothetical protein
LAGKGICTWRPIDQTANGFVLRILDSIVPETPVRFDLRESGLDFDLRIPVSAVPDSEFIDLGT